MVRIGRFIELQHAGPLNNPLACLSLFSHKDYYELEYESNFFVLFHYPLEEWNKFYRGAYQLHGHQHNNSLYNYENLQKGLRRYDVGVDANNFKPVSIDEIIKFFEMIKEMK